MICFIIYIAANIGLGIQRNYAALLVLRCIQSAGSSGTVALSQGVVADIVSSSERGTYMAFASVTSIVGPILGPIMGGLISQYLGWPWIFWFLAILSTAYFVPFLLFFPETCRNVVGDGSLSPPRLNKSFTSFMIAERRAKAGIPIDEAQRAKVAKNYKLRVPNPLSTLVIIADIEAGLVLFCTGLVVACLYAVNTGIPSQFGGIYNFNDLKLSLVFIPFGSGGVISAFTTGKMMDRNYKKHAKRASMPVVKNRFQDLLNFPIERVRLEVALPLLYLSCAAMIAYGRVLAFQTSVAAPLVILFFAGYGIIAAFQVLNILMVDLNPGNAAAATAANNLFRCLLGAGATAVVVPMIEKMGVGWTYTFAALLWVCFSPLLWVLMKKGQGLRMAKKERKERREKEKNGNEEGLDVKPTEQMTAHQTSTGMDVMGEGEKEQSAEDNGAKNVSAKNERHVKEAASNGEAVLGQEPRKASPWNKKLS